MTASSTSLASSIISHTAKLQKQLDASLSVHGISLNEYLIMRQLQEAPQYSMRRIDLAESIGLSASGITRLINPMEKLGMVEKAAVSRDARVSLVKLSKAGARLFTDAQTSFQNAAEHASKRLSTAEQQQLINLLEKL